MLIIRHDNINILHTSPQSTFILVGYFRSVVHIFKEGDKHLKEDAKESNGVQRHGMML